MTISSQQASPSASPALRRAAIIGAGLIGGSIAHALRQSGACETVCAFDVSAAHAATALDRGLVDEIASSLANAVHDADIVILAVAVGRTAELLPQVLKHLSPHAIIVDTGSVKQPFAHQCELLMPPDVARRALPCHPIAGHFMSGPQFADASLMQGRLMIMTPLACTDVDVQAQVHAMWEHMGFKVICMTAQEHDAIYADLSHLPHLASFALMNHLAAGKYDPDLLQRLGGNTVREMTRGAASSARMWSDIFRANRADILRSLTGLRLHLSELEACIAADDALGLEQLLDHGRDARPVAWDAHATR